MKIQIPKYNTILKYALDTENYDFLRSAIFKKVDGKKVCNPLIDCTRVEIIEREVETLIDFFEKVIEYPGSSAVHDLNAVKDIR